MIDMTSWLIPENFADILPREARVLELMRRRCLDLFKVHGFELVQPPMVEYVDSLLTGSGFRAQMPPPPGESEVLSVFFPWHSSVDSFSFDFK